MVEFESICSHFLLIVLFFELHKFLALWRWKYVTFLEFCLNCPGFELEAHVLILAFALQNQIQNKRKGHSTGFIHAFYTFSVALDCSTGADFLQHCQGVSKCLQILEGSRPWRQKFVLCLRGNLPPAVFLKMNLRDGRPVALTFCFDFERHVESWPRHSHCALVRVRSPRRPSPCRKRIQRPHHTRAPSPCRWSGPSAPSLQMGSLEQQSGPVSADGSSYQTPPGSHPLHPCPPSGRKSSGRSCQEMTKSCAVSKEHTLSWSQTGFWRSKNTIKWLPRIWRETGKFLRKRPTQFEAWLQQNRRTSIWLIGVSPLRFHWTGMFCCCLLVALPVQWDGIIPLLNSVTSWAKNVQRGPNNCTKEQILHSHVVLVNEFQQWNLYHQNAYCTGARVSSMKFSR